MQQALIIAWGIDIHNSPKQQVSNARTCIERLANDPRVRAIYGSTGQSTGCVVLSETQNLQEAQRLASLIQVSGLPNCQVIPLLDGQQLVAGLQEAEKLTGAVPEAFKSALAGEP